MQKPNITQKELHINYKRLARILHPDNSPDNPNSSENFQELQTQYNKAQKLICSKIQYQVSVNISLKEAIKGCDRFFINDEGQKFMLELPAGAKNKQKILYRGMAINTVRDAILHVRIHIDLPPEYAIAGDNLILQLRVSYWKLIFGGVHKIIGPDGNSIQVNIPKNTKSGKMFRIMNNGLWNRVEKKRDPLYIQFFGCLI